MSETASGYGAYLTALIAGGSSPTASEELPIPIPDVLRKRINTAWTNATDIARRSGSEGGDTSPRYEEGGWEHAVAVSFLADLTFARSPMRNWWLAAQSYERRHHFMEARPEPDQLSNDGNRQARTKWPLLSLLDPDDGGSVTSSEELMGRIATATRATPRNPLLANLPPSDFAEIVRRPEVIPVGEIVDALVSGSPYLRVTPRSRVYAGF